MLLLAPGSGKEAQKRLVESMDNAGGYLKDRAGKLAEPIGDYVEKGKRGLNDTLNKSRESLDAWKETAKSQMDAAANAGREAAHEAGRQMEKGGRALQDV
jgi:gas vesicle protein